MSTFKITEQGLQAQVDAIPVQCSRCTHRAVKVVRCRRYAARHTLLCSGCIGALEFAIARAGHVHCEAADGCPDVGRQLHDVAEIFDI